MNWYLLVVIIILITIVYFSLWIMLNNHKKNDKEILSNMIGKVGLALRDVNATPKSSAVQVGSKLWKAKTDGTEIIKKGSRIQVVKVENDVLIVKANTIIDEVPAT